MIDREGTRTGEHQADQRRDQHEVELEAVPLPGVSAQLMKNPLARCTFQIAPIIVTESATAANSVRAPAISRSPPSELGHGDGDRERIARREADDDRRTPPSRRGRRLPRCRTASGPRARRRWPHHQPKHGRPKWSIRSSPSVAPATIAGIVRSTGSAKYGGGTRPGSVSRSPPGRRTTGARSSRPSRSTARSSISTTAAAVRARASCTRR